MFRSGRTGASGCPGSIPPTSGSLASPFSASSAPQVQQNQSVMSTQPRVMLTPQGELTLARARLASEIFARKAAEDDKAALQEELAETKFIQENFEKHFGRVVSLKQGQLHRASVRAHEERKAKELAQVRLAGMWKKLEAQAKRAAALGEVLILERSRISTSPRLAALFAWASSFFYIPASLARMERLAGMQTQLEAQAKRAATLDELLILERSKTCHLHNQVSALENALETAEAALQSTSPLWPISSSGVGSQQQQQQQQAVVLHAPEARRYSPGLWLYDAVERYGRKQGAILHWHLAAMEASGATPAQMDIARFGIENARRVRVLGSGTFGCVTEVQYAGESYALKEAKTDAGLPAQITEQLVFQSLQPYREEEGAQYIVEMLAMDDTKPGAPLLLRQASGTLQQVLERSDGLPLTFSDCLRLAIQFLKGLEYLHGKGFIHNDLKPANLLIHTNGDGSFTTKIADMGMVTRSHGFRGPLVGTNAYLAPETLGKTCVATPAADTFAAGIILLKTLLHPTKRRVNLFTHEVVTTPEDQSIIQAAARDFGTRSWEYYDTELSMTAKYTCNGGISKLVTPDHLALHCVPEHHRAWVCEGLRAAISTCPDSRPTPVELRAYMEYIYDCVVGAPASSTSAPDPRVPSQYIPVSVVPTPTSVGEGARGSARIDRQVERGSGPRSEETRTARAEAAIKVCLGIGAPIPNAVTSGLSREREAPLWRLRGHGSDGGCMIGSPVPGTAFSVTDLES